jgi:hypothetical protein
MASILPGRTSSGGMASGPEEVLQEVSTIKGIRRAEYLKIEVRLSMGTNMAACNQLRLVISRKIGSDGPCK